ncbi:MAG: LuxR C-terminal-related transcriptional regulator [Anaerolineaceae bacterium]
MSDLLATKFSLPVISRSINTRVERSRLSRQFEEALMTGSRLVLVSAPAGFGKTTCVLAWLEESSRGKIGWLSLDAGDDDPARFFLYLIAALQKCAPSIGRELEGVLRSGQLPPPEIISAALINEILELPEEIILVLDDFHILQDALILDFMEKWINNLPANLKLALVTREDPPFSLSRLRANGLLTEIRAGELRFTSPETRAFLSQGMHLDLSTRDIKTLEERTEGWAAGLQLAGLSLQGQVDPSAFIAALKGSQRFILNYLVEEVLNHQPEETRQFLLQVSILERFNAAVCDAVTGRHDSREMLARMYQANLFLIPLDENLDWFRYHHLFGDLLRDQLSVSGSGQTTELHHRATGWFIQNDRPLEAIDHALAAGDYPHAIEMLESRVLELIFQGLSSRVEKILKAIPAEHRGKSIRTSLAFAWLYIFRGNFEKAFFYYQQLLAWLAGPAGEQPRLSPALEAEWLALQAMLSGGQGSPAECIKLAEKALEIAPRDNAYVLTLIYMSLASAYQILDDYSRAIEAYNQIIHNARLTENFDSEIMGYAILSQIMLNHGHYHNGFEIVSRGVSRVEETGLTPPISAALYGSLGEIYFQWNQLEKALAYYQRAGQLSHLCGYSDGEICLHAILSRHEMQSGDLAAAEVEIEKGLELMRHLPPAWVREVALAQQVRVMLACDRLAEAESAFHEMARSDAPGFHLPVFSEDQRLTPELGYIITAALRILLYRARNCGGMEHIPAGLDLAGKVVIAAGRGEFVIPAIEAVLIQAEMHTLLGEPAAAQGDLLQALELGEKEGLLRVFMESGPPVRDLLRELPFNELPAAISPTFVERILAAIFQTAPPAGKPPAAEKAALLTGRECEVLRLMSRGLTYEEIAKDLVISLNTVRSHVKAVYGKLNTNNRTQAIASAREQGLLDA